MSLQKISNHNAKRLAVIDDFFLSIPLAMTGSYCDFYLAQLFAASFKLVFEKRKNISLRYFTLQIDVCPVGLE